MSLPTHRFSFLRQAVLVATVAVACCALSSGARAAIQTRNVLKSYFLKNDVPTEAQFGDLIDSFIHRIDDGLSYNGATPDPALQGALLSEDTEIGPGLNFAPVAGLGEDWVGQSGYLGLSLELNAQTHYGYLQISSPPDDQYPMFVEYVVVETDPGVPITATHVPEPSSLALLMIGSLVLLRSRRRGH